jgi:serine/threonine protein kinase
MSPEVASHQVYNVSADVYSWAMVCYEIFVLEKPFHGWTRDMHANLVCGRGARPDTSPLPPSVRPMLEVCWNQYAYRRPAMRVVEQKMKRLEEQQLLVVCGEPAQVAVELPQDFSIGMRKMPNRNHSETYTAATVSMSTESLSSYMYP